MSLSELLPLIIIPIVIIVYIILQVFYDRKRKKKEKMPELDDFIVAEFEKEYKRIKGDE